MTADYKTLEQFPTLRIYADGKIYDERLGRCRKPSKNGEGYIRVKARDASDIIRDVHVHRLIAMAWIPNPENLSQVDHIDHNRANNNLQNLRWVSAKTNQRNQTLRRTNTTGFQGIQHRPEYPKAWVARWRNEDSKEGTKAFKHKGDAIEYREQMVKKYYKRPIIKRQDCDLCPLTKSLKKYMLIELSVAMKYNLIVLKSI